MPATYRAADHDSFANVALGPLALAANAFWQDCMEFRDAYAVRAYPAAIAALSRLIEGHACAGWPDAVQSRARARMEALHVDFLQLLNEVSSQ